MKKINTSFSLFDFNKKRADKVQIFGKESLDEMVILYHLSNRLHW